MELRGVISEKQILSKILEQPYLSATSEKDFYRRLEELQITLYRQRGKVRGVKMNRKFRFKTVGFSRQMIADLNKQISKKQRLRELQKIKQQISRDLIKE